MAFNHGSAQGGTRVRTNAGWTGTIVRPFNGSESYRDFRAESGNTFRVWWVLRDEEGEVHLIPESELTVI